MDILLWSVVEFKNKIEALTGMDPFANGSTAAGVTMSNYLANYLPENAILVNKDYTENINNFSTESLKWIRYIEKMKNIKIKSAYGCREAEININKKYLKVDGYDKKNNIVYQFHGCYCHGYQKCYKQDDLNKEKNKLMMDLYNNTIETSKNIKTDGYKLIEIWQF